MPPVCRNSARSLLAALASGLLLGLGCRPATPEATVAPGYVAYHSAMYGWTVEYPAAWELQEPATHIGTLGRAWEGDLWQTATHAGGEQAFGSYTLGLWVAPAIAQTVTGTLAIETAPMIDSARASLAATCCASVDGTEAMTIAWGRAIAHFGRREVSLLQGDVEYRLVIAPDPYLFQTEADLAIREAFAHLAASLHTLGPPQLGTLVTPAATPAPTPTSPS